MNTCPNCPDCGAPMLNIAGIGAIKCYCNNPDCPSKLDRCPNCRSTNLKYSRVKDVPPKYVCNECGNEWNPNQ